MDAGPFDEDYTTMQIRYLTDDFLVPVLKALGMESNVIAIPTAGAEAVKRIKELQANQRGVQGQAYVEYATAAEFVDHMPESLRAAVRHELEWRLGPQKIEAGKKEKAPQTAQTKWPYEFGLFLLAVGPGGAIQLEKIL